MTTAPVANSPPAKQRGNELLIAIDRVPFNHREPSRDILPSSLEGSTPVVWNERRVLMNAHVAEHHTVTRVIFRQLPVATLSSFENLKSAPHCRATTAAGCHPAVRRHRRTLHRPLHSDLLVTH